MGEVYLAKDPRLGRDVAIKVLPASFSADPDRLRRFEQEAGVAGILNHPNIRRHRRRLSPGDLLHLAAHGVPFFVAARE